MGIPSLLIALCMTLMLAFMPAQAEWTAFRDAFTYKCPKNQFFSYMRSVYNSGYRDRIWEFKCQEFSKKAKAKKCSWTENINEIEKDMFYTCPGNKAMAGLKSVHSITHGDRQYQLYCCEIKTKTLHSCFLSNFLNNFSSNMVHTTGTEEVVTGMFSRFDTSHKDRIFQVYRCKVPTKNIPKKFFK